MTLIALIDRVRMLDNDLIRLKTKLEMVLQQKEQQRESDEKNEEAKPGSNSDTGTYL